MSVRRAFALLVTGTVLAAGSARGGDWAWSGMSSVGAPSARAGPVAVWTGSRMIVWGGYAWPPPKLGGVWFNNGGMYDPVTDSWTLIGGIPDGPRAGPTAVWTGTQMILWGGSYASYWPGNAARFDPVTNHWTATAVAGTPAGRTGHTAVWTGTRMIIWGGHDGTGVLATGGRYDPAADSWSPVSSVGAPAARSGHLAVWTGARMIVWGGSDGTNALDSGGVYDPVTDSWSPMSAAGVPAGAYAGVWSGSKLIVWSGWRHLGGLYDPSTDSWSPMSTSGASPALWGFSVVWTGREMIVWGGFDGTNPVNTGSSYDPVQNAWTDTVTTGAPSARYSHAAVRAGSRMVVWGGTPSYPVPLGDGALYVDQSPPVGISFFTLSQPCRFLDTREPGPGSALGPGELRTLGGLPSCGIPAGATAVALNVAVTLGSAGGNLRLFPSDVAAPQTSAINFGADQTRSNNAVIGLSSDGLASLSVRNDAPGTVHLILDVTGYFQP